jgi:branched-chain amino acid transport system ATP-binding protein
VNDVSFSLTPGSITALVGPNGAGKTTLLNAISGLVPGATGTTFIAGREVSRLAPVRRAALGLARTFQLVRLFDDLSVRANVQIGQVAGGAPSFFAALLHLPSHQRYENETRARATALLEAVGLSGMNGRPATALSHGQGRRVELARALAARPAVLLLDEPTSGLHAGVIGELVPVIRRAAAEGAAILVVEHNLKFVGEVASRVLVLDRGRLIADGPPESVTADPNVVAAYLGSAAQPRTSDAASS